MDPQLWERIKHCKTLPAIPSLPLQVLKLCRDEQADSKKIAEVISKDPTFVAKLLNVANSGFYGGARHQVTTISQGVTLLGMNAIATLAFCFSLYRDLRKKGTGQFDHARYWRRSILSSLAARVLGKWTPVLHKEECFLGALLQDIGMLVLSETLAEHYKNVYDEAGQDHGLLERLEQHQWGADHSAVGAWLAETWELPEILQHIIRGSHDPDRVQPSDDDRPAIQCVALSGRLADIWFYANTEKALEKALMDAVELSQAYFNFQPQEMLAILQEMNEGLPEISNFFEANIGSPEEGRNILALAQQLLATSIAGGIAQTAMTS